MQKIAALLRRFALPLSIAYAFGLAAVNGWLGHSWQGAAFAAGALSELRMVPFYYHYYTTEQSALLSLTSVCLMYAPIGILAWAFWSPASIAFLIASFAAVIVETGKLFLDGLHPDTTNIAIGACAAWGSARLAQRLGASRPGTQARDDPSGILVVEGAATTVAGEARGGDDGRHAAVKSPASATRRRSSRVSQASVPETSPGLPRWANLSAVIGLVAWGAITFPIQPVLLGALLAAYGVTIWRHPPLILAAIPAVMPMLDFAPWSGRFYFDEFDLLVLLSIGVGYVRASPARQQPRRDALLFAACALLAVSYAIGTLRGLLPWQAPDANSFNNYLSPFNALRVAKGALWAFLLFPLLDRLAGQGDDVRRYFSFGTVAGLCGTVAVIIWERGVFPGLLNFAETYRVTGPFSQMHTGGADVECYLTVAAPFLVLLIFQARSWAGRFAGGALLASATYALMGTFSRVGYAGYAVALVVSVLANLAA